MTAPGAAAAAALDQFIQRTLASYPTLHEPWDPEWRSPCECGEPVHGLVPWRPARRIWPADSSGHDFAGLEHALGISIHPDIRAFFGSWWSAGLEAEASDGHVSLILLWNDEDVERLVGNLVGHAMAKRKLKEPFTVFFACTEADAEEFLSIDNSSGAVLLEKPGYAPLRQVAPDLATFLASLSPANPNQHPERQAGPSRDPDTGELLA